MFGKRCRKYALLYLLIYFSPGYLVMAQEDVPSVGETGNDSADITRLSLPSFINDTVYQGLLREALSIQVLVDSLKDEARDARKKIRYMKDSFEKYQLRKRVVFLEDSACNLQIVADSLFHEISNMEQKGEACVGENPYIILDTIINDIKVYRYNLPKEPVRDHTGSTNRYEGKPSFGLDEDTFGASFALLDSSPYSDTFPFDYDFTIPDGPFYRIQLAVFSNPAGYDYFGGLFPITAEILNNDGKERLTKYFAGKFRNLEKAETALEKVRKLGYRDAFIVSYYNRIRMSANKVYQYEKQEK